jgi:putative AdoMet-dependent methyltransferase
MAMKVHEAARLLGVTPRALRFYEEKGLLQPHKEAENGYRLYGEDDLIRLRWIISLRELGLSISAIQEAMPAIEQPKQWISKLDRARAALYAEWLTAKEALEALDSTLTSWKQSGTAHLTQIEQAARKMKENRLERAAWRDDWNVDELAASFGIEAPYELLKRQVSEEQYRSTLLQTAEWLNPQPGEWGLELGAGSGNLSELLAASGARLTAVEQSAQMLTVLSSRLPQLDAKQGNLLSLPLSGQAYAFVGCSFAMQHLNHAQQLLAFEEIDRVLQPGGRVAIAGFMVDDRDASTYEAVYEHTQGFVYCSMAQLTQWLEQRGYSASIKAIDAPIYILYASKHTQ